MSGTCVRGNVRMEIGDQRHLWLRATEPIELFSSRRRAQDRPKSTSLVETAMLQSTLAKKLLKHSTLSVDHKVYVFCRHLLS